MNLNLVKAAALKDNSTTLVLFTKESQLSDFKLSKEASAYLKKQLKDDKGLVEINLFSHSLFFLKVETPKDYKEVEKIRTKGATFTDKANAAKCKEVLIADYTENEVIAKAILEGSALANYQFLKYFSAFYNRC